MSRTDAQSQSPEPIVRVSEPVTLAGGADFSTALLNISLRLAPHLVCADGGANAALAAGLTPRAVIGDLDSLSDAARAAFADRLHRIDDPDTTDFEKVVDRTEAPLLIGLGFLGGRLDHTLAALNALARRAHRPIVLLGAEDTVFLAPPRLHLDLPPGTAMALLPLGACRVTTTGLRWNLSDAALAPDARISSSNETAARQVHITSTGPLAITLPPEHLPAATAAVLAR